MKTVLQICILITTTLTNVAAQDPKRFKKELSSVLEETSAEVQALTGAVLFTGSSSIRFWKNIQDYFPKEKILNRGFGGSETSDLIYYSNDLILKYKPKNIFIYEGDNDIANNEHPKKIIRETKKLIKKIRSELTDVPIVLISAKPSLSRWHLKDKYIDLNNRFAKYCDKHEQAFYADTWSIMLNADGSVMEELFIEDGLHMNSKGYDLWAKVLSPLF